MTQEELENGAYMDLSNYDAQGVDVDGMMADNYDGGDDPYLDFAGISQTFADSISRDTIFNFTIVNAAAATRYTYLFTGYDLSKTGKAIDGAFNDRDGNAGLTGSGDPTSISAIQNYVNLNPSLVAGFKVTSTDALQIGVTMVYNRLSPFRTEKSQNIFLGSHTDENNFNDKVATVKQELFLDDQSELLLPIAASATTVVQFYFGVSLNKAKALEKKTRRARTNIARIGVNRVRRSRAIGGGGAQRIAASRQLSA